MVISDARGDPLKSPTEDSMKAAVIEVIRFPLKAQERQDELIDKIFMLKIKQEQKTEIASFFKLVGSRISELSVKSKVVIMRLIFNLEMDADATDASEEVSTSIKDEGATLADKDTEWNAIIFPILMQKIREAYTVLGIDNPAQQSPADMVSQKNAIDAYVKSERLDIEKSLLAGGEDALAKKVLQ